GRTPRHVERWVRQFPADEQDAILLEMDHVLSQTYLCREECEEFLKEVVQNKELTGGSPQEFWRSVNFLRIQRKGESQRHMLLQFQSVLECQVGLRLCDCGSPRGPYFYLDDCLFTSTHLRWDLIEWIRTAAPPCVRIHLIVFAAHKGRLRYTCRKVAEEARAKGKEITLEHC